MRVEKMLTRTPSVEQDSSSLTLHLEALQTRSSSRTLGMFCTQEAMLHLILPSPAPWIVVFEVTHSKRPTTWVIDVSEYAHSRMDVL